MLPAKDIITHAMSSEELMSPNTAIGVLPTPENNGVLIKVDAQLNPAHPYFKSLFGETAVAQQWALIGTHPPTLPTVETAASKASPPVTNEAFNTPEKFGTNLTVGKSEAGKREITESGTARKPRLREVLELEVPVAVGQPPRSVFTVLVAPNDVQPTAYVGRVFATREQAQLYLDDFVKARPEQGREMPTPFDTELF